MFACVLFVCLCFGLSAAQLNTQASIIVHPPTYSTATTGQTVRMTCAAYGIPKPTITWSAKDALPLPANSKQYSKTVTVNDTDFEVSVLEICDVKTTDTREYSCTASNGVNSGPQVASGDASFFLSVSGTTPEPPAIVVRPPATDMTMVDIGSTLEAVCVAYGNPIPTVMWKKDGCTDLSCSANSKMYDEMVTYGEVSFRKSIIQICNVTEAHSGWYTCTAMNGISGDGVAPSQSSWQLSVKPKPASTSVSIPAPPTTTCPSYAPYTDTRGTVAPTDSPTTGRLSENTGGLDSSAYIGIIVVLALIIVALVVTVVVMIIIALKMKGSPTRQKAEIAVPPNVPQVHAVENPIHDDEEALVDEKEDADTMTYADLAKKMASEGDD